MSENGDAREKFFGRFYFSYDRSDTARARRFRRHGPWFEKTRDAIPVSTARIWTELRKHNLCGAYSKSTLNENVNSAPILLQFGR